jgi:hypothetical protein
MDKLQLQLLANNFDRSVEKALASVLKRAEMACDRVGKY